MVQNESGRRPVFREKALQEMVQKESDRRPVFREKALQEMVQKESDRRPVFVATYDPRLPDLPGIQKKHWRSITLLPPLII